MTFTITYRDRSSALVKVAVECANRSEAFAKAKENGWLVVSIQEGDKTGKRKTGFTGISLPRWSRHAASLLIVLLGCGIAAWFWLSSEKNPTEKKQPEKKPGTIKEVTPVKITLPKYKEVITNKEEMIVLPNGVITNKPKTIAEAIAMVRLKPGFHRYKSVDEVFSKTNDFQIGEYKQSQMKSSTERMLSLIAGMSPDRIVPPMPPLHGDMKKDFEKAMANILSVQEGDTEQDLKIKERVQEMKYMMKALIEKEGMTVSQAYKEMEKEHNRLANMYQLYRGEYIKMVRDGHPDANTFLDQANAALHKEGAPKFDADARLIDD